MAGITDTTVLVTVGSDDRGRSRSEGVSVGKKRVMMRVWGTKSGETESCARGGMRQSAREVTFGGDGTTVNQ